MADPKCPVCGKYDEADHFTCTGCKKDNICGSHFDVDYLVCTACSSKKKKKTGKVEKRSLISKQPETIEIEGDDDGEEIGTPFNFKRVKCPVCGTTNDAQFFKSKIYSERKTDVDKHCTEFGWQHPGYKKFHPPLYLFWHCNKCQYTDNWMDFEKPDKEVWSNWRNLKHEYIERLQDDETFEDVLSNLSEDVNYSKINHYTSMKMHLAAALIQTIIEDPDEMDTLKLGRYFIRTGWLFRELNEMLTDDKKGAFAQQQLNAIEKKFTKLRLKWDKIPLNEAEALKVGVEYLTIAFTRHPGIKNIVAEMDLLLWISGIHLKLDDRPKAMEMFGRVIARGQQTKTKIEERFKTLEASKADTSAEERGLSVQLKKVGNYVSKARDLMQDLQSEKLKEITKKAKKILKKIGDREPEEKRAILKKKGIEARVIDRLVPVVKKKKFLGLF